MSDELSREAEDLMDHKIRIELMDGTTLYYQVSAVAKRAFHHQLYQQDGSMWDSYFAWFYLPGDRMVLINTREIIRITFLFDVPGTGEPPINDNFNLLVKREEDPTYLDFPDEDLESFPPYFIPDLIIKHRRSLEDTEIVDGVTMKTEGYYGNISSYSGLIEAYIGGIDYLGYDEEERFQLLTSKYLQFLDQDGEENFMPFANLMVIELDRSLIMPDEILDDYLEQYL